jgi:ABC-type transport system involved in multi-copper enzyme maturation permease subunit
MSAAFTIAAKDFRLLRRDARSAVILLLMPLVLIIVLGLSLGDVFARKADDQLQISVVIEDAGLSKSTMLKRPGSDNPLGAMLGSSIPIRRVHPPTGRWSDIVLNDLKDTGDIKIEVLPNRAEAQKLLDRGKRSAVVVFLPEFSDRIDHCSFIGGEFRPNPINPLDRYGVVPGKIGVLILKNEHQPIGSAIVEQVTQVSLMRVIVPWMIGQAFDHIGTPLFMERMEKYIPQLKLAYNFFSREQLGDGIRKGIGNFFGNYEFTALTWHGLTKDQTPEVKAGNAAQYQGDPPTFGRGTRRYQILVPSYTVTFAFFLVLTVGWLFVAERRHGTMVRLRAAPISRGEVLLGKMIPCFAISLMQGFALLLCGKLVFGMSWGAEPWLLIPIVASTSFAAVGLAMLVAGLAKTETQVAVYGTLLVLVLAGLSGSLMPREMMPDSMRDLSLLTPHAWALDAYEQVLHPDKAAVDHGVVWKACGVLALFGLDFNLLAWWRLRLD